MKDYCDTNILVANALRSHAFHLETEHVCKAIREGSRQGCISTHNLAEIYAILTRLPPPLRLSGPDARQIVTQDILPHFEVVVLTPSDYMDAIDRSCDTGRAGTALYDCLHIAAARKANCDVIYTFNVREFRALAPDLATRIRAPQLP